MRFSLALSFSVIISHFFVISDTSPVMDMLNHHSGRSSPAQVNSESKSPTMEGRPSSRGRGGQGGFYRGGRGRGVMGGGAPQGSRDIGDSYYDFQAFISRLHLIGSPPNWVW